MDKKYKLYWSPEGKEIATVVAQTRQAAVRKAPLPYRRYLGEIYAVEQQTLAQVPVELQISAL